MLLIENYFIFIVVVSAIVDNLPVIKHVLRNEAVFGVVKLRFKIYVLCKLPFPYFSYVIRVFNDVTSFCLQTNIEIKMIHAAADMESSEKDKCLYVSDLVEKCVWKIDRELDDQYKSVKWLTLDDNESFSMSVSSDGHLHLLKALSCILTTYGSAAELLCSIKLLSGIQNPRRAMETAIGNFIILHQLMEKEEIRESKSSERNTDLRWVVSEVTRDGQIAIRRFIASNSKQLTDPRCLSIDSDGRVFVADRESKLILLDSDLKWIQTLSRVNELKEDENEIRWPRSLFYDEEEKQLLVGSELHLGGTAYTFSRIQTHLSFKESDIQISNLRCPIYLNNLLINFFNKIVYNVTLYLTHKKVEIKYDSAHFHSALLLVW